MIWTKILLADFQLVLYSFLNEQSTSLTIEGVGLLL